MMTIPNLYFDKTFEDLFDAVSKPLASFEGYAVHPMMRTDVKEHETSHEFIIDLPGVSKENIKAELKDGYLTVTATYGENKENASVDENTVEESSEEKKAPKYVVRERFVGETKRSFFVGKEVVLTDIKAKFNDGVLTLLVPKNETYEKKEENHFISID